RRRGFHPPSPGGNARRFRGWTEEADARSPRLGLPAVPSHPAEHASGPRRLPLSPGSRGVDGDDQAIPAGLRPFFRKCPPPLFKAKGLFGKAPGRGGFGEFLRIRSPAVF